MSAAADAIFPSESRFTPITYFLTRAAFPRTIPNEAQSFASLVIGKISRCHSNPESGNRIAFSASNKKLKEGLTSFVLEACMRSAGKLLWLRGPPRRCSEEHGVEHVLVLVPWVSIQGDVDKGISLASFGDIDGFDARDRFFTYGRRQGFGASHGQRWTLRSRCTKRYAVRRQLRTLKMWKIGGIHFCPDLR